MSLKVTLHIDDTFQPDENSRTSTPMCYILQVRTLKGEITRIAELMRGGSIFTQEKENKKHTTCVNYAYMYM